MVRLSRPSPEIPTLEKAFMVHTDDTERGKMYQILFAHKGLYIHL